MQSDPRVTEILEQLKPQRDLFRSAVAEASEQLRNVLAGYRNSTGDEVERATTELGRFARGRIDPALFALVFGEEKTVEPNAIAWVDRAEAVLQEISASTHLLQLATVPPGGNLRLTVERALARIGRAFGAVRVADYARSGRTIDAEARYLDVFPFALWTRGERKIALPLIVELNGDDMHTGGLEEFLDGGQIIVLLVKGAAPPAPLTRMITPNVFVMQTANINEIVLPDGPGIVAILAETSAQFIHEKGKLTIKSTPDPKAIKKLGRIGTFQQREELAQLDRLTSGPPDLLTSEAVTEPNSEDVLAAWLLRQMR